MLRKQMFAGRFLSLGLFLALSAWISGANNQVAAGILRIETQTGVAVEGELLTVRVTATNKGTEPARRVQGHIILLAKSQAGPVKDRLDPGQAETFMFRETLTGIKKGRYPVTVRVDFHDANQYPFSAVSCTTFSWKEDANPDLLCLGGDITVGAVGELLFTVKNLGFEPREVRSTLVLPKELSTHDPRIDLQIAPRAEKRVVYDIANFSALSGASYPVFCCLEYESADTHHTAVARALVQIKKGENWFKRTKLLWLGAAIMLGVILVALQFKRKGS